LNCAPEDLTIDDGAFLQGGKPTGHDYWNFTAPEDFAADIHGTAVPKPPSVYKIVGQPVPRRDLLDRQCVRARAGCPSGNHPASTVAVGGAAATAARAWLCLTWSL
jgi:hypothetical protein